MKLECEIKLGKNMEKHNANQIQQEVLKEIAKKSDTIGLQDIKEGWEIMSAIKIKSDTFAKEIKSYKDEINALQNQLKTMRKTIKTTQQQLLTLESQKQATTEELQSLQKDFNIKKIQAQSKTQHQKIQENRSAILPGALKNVEIYLKDGSITKAKPAQKVFGEDLYKKYRVELKENRVLKNKISELELENKRLEIELRDFYAELQLEGIGALEPLHKIHKEITHQNQQSNTTASSFTHLLDLELQLSKQLSKHPSKYQQKTPQTDTIQSLATLNTHSDTHQDKQ